MTYETLGINGASASIALDWDETTLKSNVERRDPALIVLAYGTNEAGRSDLTLESYRDMFIQLIGRFRKAAPTATILVIGPPDRDVRTRLGWKAMDTLDTIVEAQRQAAIAQGCPFWDLRAKMGGKGAMQQWVNAGMAQYDHVHFTSPGYRMLGDAVFRDLMSQYDVFLKARADVLAQQDGTTGDWFRSRRCLRRSRVTLKPRSSEAMSSPQLDYYCPQCQKAAENPLVCGDCASIICRQCGTPLERIDDLGIG